MRALRKRRLWAVITIVSGVAVAVGLTLAALNKNVNLFFTPSEVLAGEPPADHVFRVGGLVEEGSVARDPESLEVRFGLTDTNERIVVTYIGILPDLFREGQGIIAQGKLNGEGVFEAEQVLAKHDENYMPPEVYEAIKTAQMKKSAGP